MKLKFKEKVTYLEYEYFRERLDKAVEDSLGTITEYSRKVSLEEEIALFREAFDDKGLLVSPGLIVAPSYSIVKFAIGLINKDFQKERVDELTNHILGSYLKKKNSTMHKRYTQLLVLWATATAIVLWKSGKLNKPDGQKYFFYCNCGTPLLDEPKYLPQLYHSFLEYKDNQLDEYLDKLGFTRMTFAWLVIGVARSIDWWNILDEAE